MLSTIIGAISLTTVFLVIIGAWLNWSQKQEMKKWASYTKRIHIYSKDGELVEELVGNYVIKQLNGMTTMEEVNTGHTVVAINYQVLAVYNKKGPALLTRPIDDDVMLKK